jgi:hypothetical protein
MATRIDTVDARGRLEPRAEPYGARVNAGRQIGFRKMTPTSTGTWIAEFRDADEDRREKRSLGTFDHLPPSQRHDAAKAAAEEWFRHLRKGGTGGKVTVRAACETYVEHLRSLGKGKTADDVKRRFAQYVNDKPLGQIELQRLKPRDVEIWRKSLATTMVTPQDKRKAPTRPRSASTLNRDMTPLRAALNLALADGHVTTDASWKAKMRPLKDAGRRHGLRVAALHDHRPDRPAQARHADRGAVVGHAPADDREALRAPVARARSEGVGVPHAVGDRRRHQAQEK